MNTNQKVSKGWKCNNWFDEKLRGTANLHILRSHGLSIWLFEVHFLLNSEPCIILEIQPNWIIFECFMLTEAVIRPFSLNWKWANLPQTNKDFRPCSSFLLLWSLWNHLMEFIIYELQSCHLQLVTMHWGMWRNVPLGMSRSKSWCYGRERKNSDAVSAVNCVWPEVHKLYSEHTAGTPCAPFRL